MEKIVIIRLRGTGDVPGTIESTMRMLKLHKVNTCSVYDKTPNIVGMANRAKDFVTYGEIDEETLKSLQEKRGITIDGKLENYFHLHPAKGGLGKGGVKHSFRDKGALGYRGVKINDLIKKML